MTKPERRIGNAAWLASKYLALRVRYVRVGFRRVPIAHAEYGNAFDAAERARRCMRESFQIQDASRTEAARA